MNKRHSLRLVIIVLLLLALVLQGCMLFPAAQSGATVPQPPPPEEEAEEPVVPISVPRVRGRFTLRYDPESPINPIISLSSDNIILSSLMYESLFVLDGNLNVQPVLCESWTTEDNITYRFELRAGISMSDGTTMTAEDAAYSLRQAVRIGRFANRLRNIRSITTDGNMTLVVVLHSPHNRFVNLLDVPIIKSGSIEYRVPPGTGPYIFSDSDEMRLERFAGYRRFLDLPVSSIYLRQCGDHELTELFDNGELSLLWDDPSNVFDIRINRFHETRFYDTTALQFIGFNTRIAPLRDQNLRRAIGFSIERDYIVSEIMPGQSLAAPLAISPAYRLYNPQWESSAAHPHRAMAALLFESGFEDHDNDTFLEYPDGGGGFMKFTIDFIVNSENTHKVQAAHRIASSLRRTGINVVVRELPWPNFINALELKDFDMFYGETVLSADFDISSLVLPGGRLDYGGMGNAENRLLIDNFLSAGSDASERAAARLLCEDINIHAPFVPILYKRYAIYTPMGAVSGAEPSQSGVFRSFTDWLIDLTMLT